VALLVSRGVFVPEERRARQQKERRLLWLSYNTLEFRGNYSATSNNMKLVHWPLMGGLLHLVQRGGDCIGGAVARPGPSSLYQM